MAQTAGETSLRLGFKERQYGPNAEDLNLPFQKFEGHYTIGRDTKVVSEVTRVFRVPLVT